MITIENFTVKAFSLLTEDGLQMVRLRYKSSKAAHLLLSVYRDKEKTVSDHPVAIDSGTAQTRLLLPCARQPFKATFVLHDKTGVIAQTVYEWKTPRKWTLYAMVSSHTDLGLHNSHYIQRYNAARLLDEAARLCEETKNSSNGCFRYTVEGTAVWNGYASERGKEAARSLAENHVNAGRIGVCCGLAGNHTQTYGLEEMCRSAYERRRLNEYWGIKSETLAMIDNNGLSAAMIQPYAEAGYKNIIFAPNPWNPIPSGIWRRDTNKPFYQWNSDAGGGGSRIDVKYDSALPMVFDWTDRNNNKLTVWASASYLPGGARFGMATNGTDNLSDAEEKTADTLDLLEEKYPYDVWLFACYGDDQVPNRALADTFMRWNQKWAFPKFETLGNPDLPFDRIREKFGDSIPKLYGDITGGWYQHPVSVPELLAQKFDADRLLPTAEKWAVVAALTNCDYRYPAEEFDRAWKYLLCNDEHSYGTSEYSGRPVYETWMQHRDWIEKASAIAQKELNAAVKAIASKLDTEEPKTVYFNPTLKSRTELVQNGSGYAYVTVPPLGYTAVAASEFTADEIKVVKGLNPPVAENEYYKIEFCRNGAIKSIYDKELDRELIKQNCEYYANELIYTNDNHKTFYVPGAAEFTVTEYSEKTVITSVSEHKSMRSEVIGTVTLYKREKRIDIDNTVKHPRDMINNCRYNRYVYYSFPFDVDNCKRYCHLNGTVAEYATDVTGHGTDVYMATREWCCCQNGDFGIALTSLDSQLVEFGEIHPDKTDFGRCGDGSEVFVYAANDWLQKHTPGGSHLEFRFRFCIYSYSGDYGAAGVTDLSERFSHPLCSVNVEKQRGTLNGTKYSFLSADPPVRLLTLKRADDGRGIIARVYGETENVRFIDGRGKTIGTNRCTVDEQDENVSGSGFITYRLDKDLNLPVRQAKSEKRKNNAPSDIGGTHTGLITEPRAACGAENGRLYLLWGKCADADLSHYEIYRSETSGFTANESTFVARVSPERYCVESYEDVGLKNHTEYFYRISAVNASGVRGNLSKEFSAFTKE